MVALVKVTEYLLNELHPDNGGKAAYFKALGYSEDRPQELVDALLQVAWEGSIKNMIVTVHGAKYVVDGRLASPSGKRSVVRTIWIIDSGEETPRLVTAYPGSDEEAP